MFLVSPSIDFELAFQRFYLDYVSNDPINGECYASCLSDFSSYVEQLSDESRGLNLKPNYVPCSHYWLINSDSEVLGVVRIRHHLANEFLQNEAGHIGYDVRPSYRNKGVAKKMLALALLQAKTLKLDQVLITADDDNKASRRVIETNGGQFDTYYDGKVFQTKLARYWIDLQ
ncbi:MAG TPA: GNAT family N-acetyltransferase [Vibrio sp.]|nr:GNAT family N-acetyltransferase [Vibrio sp.]